ncbi:MAG: hypothetical protein ACYDAC_12475 [Candidatus Dormibacteria bacterium]
MRRCGALTAVLAASVLAACGGARAQLDGSSLGLPQATSPPVLASTTLDTSPDGGIYSNPDHLDVLLLTRGNAGPVQSLLGGSAAGWSDLARFGPFTMVALRLRNDGKAGSDPQLNQLQLASDYAPAGTASGPLRRFYHPTWPLALLATSAPGDGCSLHIDPGHSVVAILVYPPADLPKTVVWGAYHSFVLSIPRGGAVPPLGSLRAAPCTPPPSLPAAPPTA